MSRQSKKADEAAENVWAKIRGYRAHPAQVVKDPAAQLAVQDLINIKPPNDDEFLVSLCPWPKNIVVWACKYFFTFLWERRGEASLFWVESRLTQRSIRPSGPMVPRHHIQQRKGRPDLFVERRLCQRRGPPRLVQRATRPPPSCCTVAAHSLRHASA